MSLTIIGVNHKTAPIEVRERIAISREDLPETTRALAAVPGVTECMIVSTCNRVEILASVESASIDLAAFLHRHFGLEPAMLAPHLYQHYDQEAVRHLFRVSASLDSMVVGEPQILGQVKEAFAVARASGTVGGQLEHLLQSAFAAAKRSAQRRRSARILFPSPRWPWNLRARFLVRCKGARFFWWARAR